MPHVVVVAAFGLAVYTQLAHLLVVPGLHFDEAWQGMLAYRIMHEPGFYPTGAMNSYTTPVIHYLLAGVFKIFGPSFATLRAAFAAMNLATLGLIAGLLWRTGERLAVAWFALLWALLPLSVHDHRFYVELTGFHGLCLALVFWGVALWQIRPALSFALITLPIVAATYSHILFIAVFAGGVLVLARAHPRDFRTPRARALVATLALLLLPLPIRMGLGLGKAAPFALAAALALTALWALATPFSPRLNQWWMGFPRRSMRTARWLFIAALPFLFAFVGLIWNGFWPYAQATGHLFTLWLPLNAVLFIALAWLQLRRHRRPAVTPESAAPRAPRMQRMYWTPTLSWGAFISTFVISSILILKQSPRYYMVPSIFAMIWCAQRLARLRSIRVQLAIAAAFTAWNLWAFQISYIDAYRAAGPTTHEFKFGPFHDNARDFRPFQLAFEWLVSQNCQQELKWVEDDRFLFPVELLRLTAPAPTGQCPWTENQLFFSHIPNYDPAFAGSRTDENTPPPYPNVKFLAHFKEWGDLAFWTRR